MILLRKTISSHLMSSGQLTLSLTMTAGITMKINHLLLNFRDSTITIAGIIKITFQTGAHTMLFVKNPLGIKIKVPLDCKCKVSLWNMLSLSTLYA